MKKKAVFLIFVFIILGGCLLFLCQAHKGHICRIVKARVLAEKKKHLWLNLNKILEKKVLNFNGAVSIVIKDFETGREIAFNKDALIPSASLVKVPIMLSCFYAAQDGKISLKDRISLKQAEKVGGSKILASMPVGSVFTVDELFYPMITQSDNSAANLLIDFLGFDTLNAYFKKIGLKNTNISRRMMDFEERTEGIENYTTAQDMAYLLEKLYRGDFLSKDISAQCLSILGQQKINDRIPRKLPKNGIYIAHKTGLERYVCHDIGVVFTQKGDFLICILVKHDYRRAWQAKKLISDIALLTYNYYRSSEFN